MMKIQALGFLVCALFAAECPGGRDNATSQTIGTLRALAAGLDDYRDRVAGLPDSLSEVCRRQSGCRPEFPSTARLEDAWGRAIVYTRTERSYSLRSAGRDGRSGTDDDLTLSPELEHARRQRFAGCYALTSSGTDVPKFVELDTLRAAAKSSLYAVRIDHEAGLGWMPLDDAEFEIHRYDSPHATTVIRLRMSPAGVYGRRMREGAPSVGVVAARARCPEG